MFLVSKTALATDGTLVVRPGVTAERLQPAFDRLPARVRFLPGTYDFDRPLRFPGCPIDGYGAQVCLRASGDVMGHQIQTGTHLEGFSFCTERVNAPSFNSGLWHSVLHAGVYYGAGSSADHWSVRRCSIQTVNVPGANGIAVYGAATGWRIEDVRVPDSDSLARPVSVHWGCAKGLPVQATWHPAGTIDGLDVGRLTASAWETAPVILSGAANVRVRRVNCRYSRIGLILYCGDYGFDYQSPRLGGLASVADYRVEACELGVEVLGWKYQVPGRPAEALNVRVERAVFGAASPQAKPYRYRCVKDVILEAEFRGFQQPPEVSPDPHPHAPDPTH